MSLPAVPGMLGSMGARGPPTTHSQSLDGHSILARIPKNQLGHESRSSKDCARSGRRRWERKGQRCICEAPIHAGFFYVVSRLILV